MGRLTESYERFLWAIGRQSGRVVSVIAAVTYGGVGLALPLAFDWSVSWLVTANMIGTSFAGLFALTWIANGVQASYRRKLIEWTTDLRHLSAQEFEWLVGEVFRREGWKVDETGSQTGPDGNVDLRLARKGARVLVQCKRWESWLVGVDEIRAFGGTLLRERLPGTAGIFVTLSDFTDAARADAKDLGLTLLDGRDLYARVERVRTQEPCPICESPMKLDRSPHGWWFRCLAPGCSGKRNLGSEPALAVQILTEGPEK
ncbi:MAG: restriction endonuclease [Chloroflexi bacterium]|nr:restriction endonuclease [Chloroflexota bacterium]